MSGNTNPDKKMAAQRNNKTFAKYNYPLTPGEHNIVMVFRDYNYDGTRKGFISESDYYDNKTQGAKKAANARASAGISLPIPQNLVDNYSVKVGAFELGITGATALDAMTDSGRNAALADVKKAISDVQGGSIDDVTLSGVTSTLKSASAFMGRNALESLPGGAGIAGAVDIAAGTTVNPHVALKFDGVDLKQHTFNWQLSPRNEEEAIQIKDMIRYIKSRMLPSYTLGGTSSLSRSLMSYPNLIDIYFTGLNQSYFYYFKPAMINTFTTDFTPQGLALNKGGKPSFINMTMTVTEAQIHTREDFESTSPGGYTDTNGNPSVP